MNWAVGVVGLFDAVTVLGVAVPLATAQRLTGNPNQINLISVALKGDVRTSVRRSDAAAERLNAYLARAEVRQALGLEEQTVTVQKTKQEAVRLAELAGNLFTTFFLVFGLFSIAAGVLLIFLIFVMLAAERRTEMGMVRAVGARRLDLVQAFVAEGMAYNLLAGAVGAALGVAAAFALVVVGLRLTLGDEVGGFLTAHVTPRSLVVSYCLGAVLTFLTVVASSLRISRLNIVAAIRGTDDDRRRDRRAGLEPHWIAAGLALLVVPPVGLWLLLRRGFGLPLAWVVGPLGLLAAGGLMALGVRTDQLAPWALGISLAPLAAAAIARHYGSPNRLTWTAVGALLAAYWLLPLDLDKRLLGRPLKSNIEMFAVSGVFVVTALTLIIVFNARLLTALFERGATAPWRTPALLALLTAATAGAGLAVGDAAGGLGQLFYLLAALLGLAAAFATAAARFPTLAPALKMAVAYPLASRFRTGMTIAMFSLIIFSLTVFSIINANFATLFAGDEARAGWDLRVETNRAAPVTNLMAELTAEGSFDPRLVTAAGRATQPISGLEVRRPGHEEWRRYAVAAGDDGFFAALRAELDGRARDYPDAAAVYDAVRTTPGLAIIDALPLRAVGRNGAGFAISDVAIEDGVFTPFPLQVREPATGATVTVTVIGVLSSQVSPRTLQGVYAADATLAPIMGQGGATRWYLRLVAGADTERAAKGIRAALAAKGVQATSLQAELDRQQAQGRGFARMFQGFMGLGLLVGIAALGVVAFRSVVERRQQIGMLRAIGYRRAAITLTFLLESSFVAAMGILAGIVGGSVLGRNLLNSDEFRAGATELRFFIPWGEVSVFCLAAYGFALLLTWWPSRSAARVPIAEALRYE
ncbi:MAG: FtsX-like permease family protein [Dehalococcoidia bacterium]